MAIEELNHTADLAFRITAASLEEGFAEAAGALFGVMIDVETVKPVEPHAVRIWAASEADLLVEWLSELLAQKELRELVFSGFDVSIQRERDGWSLRGKAIGERLDVGRHQPAMEVKGISYLGLRVRKSAEMWRLEFVLDV